MTSNDPIWDDVFHASAWAAYLDEAYVQQGWPDCEATRRRAFRYYEEALAAKNCRSKSHAQAADSPLTKPAKRAMVAP
jgi:hypothetical protein